MSARAPSQLLSSDGRHLDVIAVEGLRVECIVGVYPTERGRPQPLEVDLALYLDTRKAAAGSSLRETVDYARLSGELRFLLESCRFMLLETAAEALARYALAPGTGDRPRPRVEAAWIRLVKPDALGGAARPSLEILRRADEVEYEREDKPFGQVDIVHASKGCGIYRLRIAPGRMIDTHVHRVMDESELVLGSELWLQGRRMKAGEAVRWPRGLPHRYENRGAVEQTVLCVDRPAFIPDDEVPVDEPEGGLSLPPVVDYYAPDEGPA